MKRPPTREMSASDSKQLCMKVLLRPIKSLSQSCLLCRSSKMKAHFVIHSFRTLTFLLLCFSYSLTQNSLCLFARFQSGSHLRIVLLILLYVLYVLGWGHEMKGLISMPISWFYLQTFLYNKSLLLLGFCSLIYHVDSSLLLSLTPSLVHSI